jgi:hypothetical protein
VSRGDGSFITALDFSIGQNAQAVAIGDLDGDGANDFVVGNITGAMISVFRGLGKGTFEARADWAFDDDPHAIALGDLNQDGALDLVVTRWFSRGVSVWANATPLLARIDLKAGDPENHVSDHSAGRTSVGILGSDQLDVHAIDLESVQVNGSPISDHLNGLAQLRFARLDGDDNDDAIVSASAATVSSSRDGCVQVTGRLQNGRQFQGGDSIRLVGSRNQLNTTEASHAAPNGEGAALNSEQGLRVIASSRGEIRLAVRVGGSGDARVDVFNVRGACVAGDRVPSGRHDVRLRGPALGVGLYIVRLTDALGVTCSKVVIPPE